MLAIGVRLWPSREDAGVDLGEDVELDQAFQLGAGAFDVLRQQLVAESLADVPRPLWSGRVVEGVEDAGVVRVLGQVRWGSGKPVGEAGDGGAGDREMLQMGLGLPQPVLQAVDLFTEVMRPEPGQLVPAVPGRRARAGCSCCDRLCLAPGGGVRAGGKRVMTWVMAQ